MLYYLQTVTVIASSNNQNYILSDVCCNFNNHVFKKEDRTITYFCKGLENLSGTFDKVAELNLLIWPDCSSRE